MSSRSTSISSLRILRSLVIDALRIWSCVNSCSSISLAVVDKCFDLFAISLEFVINIPPPPQVTILLPLKLITPTSPTKPQCVFSV